MKLVDLSCPNCNGTIELDRDKEFGFCMYCGHKIYIDREEGPYLKNEVKNLTKLLDAAVSSEDDGELLSIANKILELDSKHSEAWFWRGHTLLFDLDITGGLASWINYAENSSTEDLKNRMNMMEDCIGRCYFEDNETESLERSAADYMNILSRTVNAGLNDAKSDASKLTKAILERLGSCIMESEDVNKILNGCSKIDMLLFNAFTYYPSIDFLQNAITSLIDVLETARKINSEKAFVGYSSDMVREVYIRLKTEVELFRTIQNRVQVIRDSTSDHELVMVHDYWLEQDREHFLTMLQEIRDLSLDKWFGLFGIKKRRARDRRLSEFFEEYMRPMHQ